MAEVKINNAQEYNLRKWSLFQNTINKIALKSIYLNYAQLAGSNIIDKIRDILIIVLTSHLIINGTYSIGVLMTIMYILGQLSGAMNRIYFFIRDYQDAHISLSRLNEIYSKEEELNNSLSPCMGNISIQDMSFKYPGRKDNDILKDMSFDIPFGQTTAIVGKSGCGKTTLVKLLLGLYTPTKGDILVNNTPISNLNLEKWRNECGCVMQDGYIFSDTLANNITMQEMQIDVGRLELVCRLSCLTQLISKLPNGVNTTIGHEGTKLSGGEKQRILIARAMYKDPSFLIFDEATSHLDAQNESQVLFNMKRLMQGKTTVIIAHRLSTIIEADNIIFLEDGRVVEKGNHSDLLQLKGKYFSLVQEQMSVV